MSDPRYRAVPDPQTWEGWTWIAPDDPADGVPVDPSEFSRQPCVVDLSMVVQFQGVADFKDEYATPQSSVYLLHRGYLLLDVSVADFAKAYRAYRQHVLQQQLTRRN